MVNNLVIPNIQIFVYGTLREGETLDFYMEGSKSLGLHVSRGQLTESANGSAFINFEDSNGFTIGELHHINYMCLQRINHIEAAWNDFPKGYELVQIPVWSFDEENSHVFDDSTKTLALCYRKRETTRIITGDWKKRVRLMDEIGNYLSLEKEIIIDYLTVINHISEYLNSLM